MTAEEENIVKHHVNCGAPKNRLTQFVLGMKSIKRKVHPVIFKSSYTCSTYICIYVRIYIHQGTVC